MNILILNWRDIKNPSSGGAEILTQEIAKKWVEWGHSVIQISSKFDGAKSEETIDGVRIIRMGKWWSVHMYAAFYYLVKLRRKTDVVIDEVHGIPFFSILYAPQKTVLLACEVADKLFFEVFPYALAKIGIFLEKVYFFLYKNTLTLAISPSTKQDLIKKGFNKSKIRVLPMGFTVPKKVKKYPKEKEPTLIFLSRINKRKGIEDAIEAFRLIKKEISNAKFWIVGSGEDSYIKKIKKIIKKKQLSKEVISFGYVTSEKKMELLSKAHLLVFPSIHEGWGLVIAEAGIVGTPSAVYNYAGVRDVVKKGERGIVSDHNNPESLAQSILNYLKDDKLYFELVNKVNSFKDEMGWEKTAQVTLEYIKAYESNKN